MTAHRWVGVVATLMLALVTAAAAACGGGRQVAARTSEPTTSPPPSSTTTVASGDSSTTGPGSSTTTAITALPPRSSTTVQRPTITGPDRRTTTTSSPPPSTPVRTGAHGLVTAGPVCPVQRVGDPCLPRALPAVDVTALDPGGHTIASTSTDNGGSYSLGLPPGDYTIMVVVNGRYPRCPATKVTVNAAGPANADIACDTGIR